MGGTTSLSEDELHDERPLSLYFKLRPGERADLEVAASTAIAWVGALRSAATALDPGYDLRVEIVNADEGSLIVNAVIRWIELSVDPKLKRLQRGYKRSPRAAQLAIALAIFAIFNAGPAYEAYFGETGLTPAEHAELHQAVQTIQSDHDFIEKQRKVFRSAERDPAIAALGVKERPQDPPLAIVESQHFAEAGGLWQGQQQDVQERTTTSVMEVVLVKPALVAAPRAWTFEQVGFPPFDAIMRDPAVLKAMGEKGLPERLRAGIPMKIRIEVHEVESNGEWKVGRGGRSVTHVISPSLD